MQSGRRMGTSGNTCRERKRVETRRPFASGIFGSRSPPLRRPSWPGCPRCRKATRKHMALSHLPLPPTSLGKLKTKKSSGISPFLLASTLLTWQEGRDPLGTDKAYVGTAVPGIWHGDQNMYSYQATPPRQANTHTYPPLPSPNEKPYLWIEGNETPLLDTPMVLGKKHYIGLHPESLPPLASLDREN